MDEYQPITCEVHDYFESACCLRLSVRLTLLDGAVVEGTALDLSIDDRRAEVLVLKTLCESHKPFAGNTTRREVALNTIAVMEAMDRPAPFVRVDVS